MGGEGGNSFQRGIYWQRKESPCLPATPWSFDFTPLEDSHHAEPTALKLVAEKNAILANHIWLSVWCSPLVDPIGFGIGSLGGGKEASLVGGVTIIGMDFARLNMMHKSRYHHYTWRLLLRVEFWFHKLLIANAIALISGAIHFNPLAPMFLLSKWAKRAVVPGQCMWKPRVHW